MVHRPLNGPVKDDRALYGRQLRSESYVCNWFDGSCVSHGGDSVRQNSLNCLIFIACFTACFGSSFAAADIIGFVTNNGNIASNGDAFDMGLLNHLTSQNYTVIEFGDNEPIPAGVSLTDIDLFIVSSDVQSTNFLTGPIGIGVPQPIITYENFLYDDIFGAGVTGSDVTETTNIAVTTSGHPIVDGLSTGTTNLFNAPGSTISVFGGAPLGPDVVVAATDTNGVPALVLTGGDTEPLRIALPFDDGTDFDLLNPTGLSLINSAVEFAVVPEPNANIALSLGIILIGCWHRRSSVRLSAE